MCFQYFLMMLVSLELIYASRNMNDANKLFSAVYLMMVNEFPANFEEYLNSEINLLILSLL